jgi:hypothetical protein
LLTGAWLITSGCSRNTSISDNSFDVDMGDVLQGQAKRAQISWTSNLNHTVLLKTATSCGCTQVELDRTSLSPGETVNAAIQYNAGRAGLSVGQHDETFVIEELGSEASPLVYGKVRALIRPVISIHPDPFFWRVLAGEGEQSTDVMITNECGEELSLEVPAVASVIRLNPSAFSIPPGGHASVTLTAQLASTAAVLPVRIPIVAKRASFDEILKFSYDVQPNPYGAVACSPGALFFAADQVANGSPIVVHVLSQISKAAFEQARSKDSRIHIINNITDSAFTATIDNNSRLESFSTEVEVSYRFDGAVRSLLLPVFVQSTKE